MLKLNENQFANYLYLNRQVKDSTVKSLSYFFRHIKTYFENIDFNKENVDAFIYDRQKVNEKSTLKNYILVLHHIGKILHLEFTKDYKTPNPTKKFIETLTTTEIKRLAEIRIKRKKNTRAINRRFRAVIYALALTGARINELCNLKWTDIINDNFIIRDSKTNEARQIPVAPKLKLILDKLPKNKYIFGMRGGRLQSNYLNLELKLRARACHIDKSIHNHTFRHSFITECLRNDQNPFKVAQIVGHKKLETTLAYTHLITDDLLNIIKEHPLATSGINLDVIKTKLRFFIEKIKSSKINVTLKEENDRISLIIDNSTKNV
jgi:integrase/recombinase XerD